MIVVLCLPRERKSYQTCGLLNWLG